MIKIDIVTAIAGTLFISIFFILTAWITIKDKKFNLIEDLSDTYQCPYCTFVFNSLKNSNILSCPQCKSYLSEKELGSEKITEGTIEHKNQIRTTK